MPAQPQSSLMGANAGTSTPQQMQAPTQVNPYKVNNQMQMLQQGGMPTAQAVNKAAINPANKFAKGGPVETPQQMSDDRNKQFEQKTLADTTKAMQDLPAVHDLENAPDTQPKDQMSPTDQQMQDMFKSQQAPAQPTATPLSKGYAKGGDVDPTSETIKKMPLEAIIKMLASHPEVAGKLSQGDPQMKTGGMAANMKSEAKGHQAGLLNMNADVQSYAQGGKVVPTYSPQIDAGTVNMADGGQLDADDITGYGPDGTPIVENADGTTGYGDINQLLDRPASASTAATGQAPMNGVTRNAANTPTAQSTEDATGANEMAKGGAEAPPGALKPEVADDVPAKLSPGEFVFSADATRFYGLRLLTAMMDHARTQLTGMANTGDIRTPGDNKNPGQTGGQFMQDSKPDMNAYGPGGSNDAGSSSSDGNDADAQVSGILKECMGGGNYAGGGMVNEVPQGGVGGEEDFAKGGIVSSRPTSLNIKSTGMGIPRDAVKLSKAPPPPKPPGLTAMKAAAKPSGALIKNMMPSNNIVQEIIYGEEIDCPRASGYAG